MSPCEIKNAMKDSFVDHWNRERKINRKLGFYNTIKEDFGCENYLDLDLSHQHLRRLTQFRTSSHRYKVETGRHGVQRNNVLNRVCNHCSTTDLETMNFLAALPTFDPIIEDELHVLQSCKHYDDLRERMLKLAKEALVDGDIKKLFTDRRCTKAVAKLLVWMHERRFPKKIPESEQNQNKSKKKTWSTPTQIKELMLHDGGHLTRLLWFSISVFFSCVPQ